MRGSTGRRFSSLLPHRVGAGVAVVQAPDGMVIPAEQLRRVTAASLHGEFATVVTTDDLLAASGR